MWRLLGRLLCRLRAALAHVLKAPGPAPNTGPAAGSSSQLGYLRLELPVEVTTRELIWKLVGISEEPMPRHCVRLKTAAHINRRRPYLTSWPRVETVWPR